MTDTNEIPLGDGVRGTSSSFRRRIRNHQPVCGVMVTSLLTPDVLTAVAETRLDFVLFDQEHFPISETDLATLCELATLHGIIPLVRIPAPDPERAGRALDLGAVGVMIPRCRSIEELEAALVGCLYPPQGERGFSSRSRGQQLHRLRTGRGSGSRSTIIRSQNDAAVVIVQLETESLLRELATNPLPERVDVLLVGARDLAVSLGDPDLEMDARDLRSRIQLPDDPQRGAALGAVAGAGPVSSWTEHGFTFLILGHDMEFFAHGLATRLERAAMPSGHMPSEGSGDASTSTIGAGGARQRHGG